MKKRKVKSYVYVLRPFNGWVKSDIKGIFATIDDVFDYFGDNATISDEHETIFGRENLKELVFEGNCDGAVIKVITETLAFGSLNNYIVSDMDYYYVSLEKFF